MDLQPANSFKSRLRGEQTLVGLWLTLGSPAAAEIASGAGFDWLLIDTEHAPNELPDVLAQLRAVEGRAGSAAVRPTSNDPDLIKRLLDIGAQTLLIPFVNNAQDALKAVAAARYAPRGIRGFSGCTRANDYGRIQNYAQQAESQLCLIAQVETQTALAQLEQIASVDGIDGVFIGVADLSVDMGQPGNTAHPSVWGAVDHAARRLRALGKPAGILLSAHEDIERARSAGFRFIAVGNDARVLTVALDRLATQWRRR